MFERFTDRARKVMALANQETQRFNHEYLGTEHVLLGLVKEGSGVGANVLKNLDVDLRKAQLEVEKLVKSGPETVTMGKLPQTPRAKKVIQYAIEEARSFNHNYVGTEHLLLGLLRVEDGTAAQVLTGLDLRLDDVRGEVLNLLGESEEAERLQSAELCQGVRERPLAWSAYEYGLAESVLVGSKSKGTPAQGLALLPNTDEFGLVFDSAIVPAMAANRLSVFRSETAFEQGPILPDAWSCICSAQAIVADLSVPDPAVAYALGLCHAKHRCPILLVRNTAKLPLRFFDLPHVKYEVGDSGLAKLQQDLAIAIEEFLGTARDLDGA